jgi:dethiobiotin synthetase
MQCKKIIILANDTNVGKTWLGCELLARAREHNLRLFPFKPLATGDRSDALRLAAASSCVLDLNKINPIFFHSPMAPYAASAIEGREISWEQIEAALQEVEKNSHAVLIETAGGILTPCDQSTNMVDLVKRWNAVAVLVVPNKLGTITQARTALEILLQRKISPLAVVLNNIPKNNDQLATDQDPFLETIRKSNFAILKDYFPKIPFFESTNYDLDNLWNLIKLGLTQSNWKT